MIYPPFSLPVNCQAPPAAPARIASNLVSAAHATTDDVTVKVVCESDSTLESNAAPIGAFLGRKSEVRPFAVAPTAMLEDVARADQSFQRGGSRASGVILTAVAESRDMRKSR